MKTKELIEYLKGYDQETEVVMIAADPRKRKKYSGGVFCITDIGVPVLCFDVQEEEDLDEEE